MPNDWFQFKQFRIEQDRCAMKVGTDGVILGAWTNPEGCRRALDIGTGTGLLALMLAQKNEMLNIDAIEMDPIAAEQAGENIRNSIFREQIRIMINSFQDILRKEPTQDYDLIVCNPPYFSDSKKTGSAQKNLARHDDSLTLEELLRGIPLILSQTGRFNIILPSHARQRLEMLALNTRLYINRILEVFPKPGKGAVRYCFEMSKKQSETLFETLVIETGKRHDYSPEYRSLTEAFYL